MIQLRRIKSEWRVVSAVTVLFSTVFIAGCPRLEGDLFVDIGAGVDPISNKPDSAIVTDDTAISEDTGITPCGVKEYTLEGYCGDGLSSDYQSIMFTCIDGTGGREGGPDYCYTAEEWKDVASKACGGDCTDTSQPEDTDQPKWCGLEDYTPQKECDGGFLYVEYSCTNGTSGILGDGSECRETGRWKDDANNACVIDCQDTDIPEDTDQPPLCGLKGFTPMKECDDGYYYTEYFCYDGTTGTVGNGYDCKVWKDEVYNACDGHCAGGDISEDTDQQPFCGLKDYTPHKECDGGFHYVDYICENGVSGTLGDGSHCLDAIGLKDYAYNTCKLSCQDTDIPEDTDQPPLCGLKDYTPHKECADGFYYVDYYCLDGASGTLGDGSDCRDAGSWKDDAYAACDITCQDTSKP